VTTTTRQATPAIPDSEYQAWLKAVRGAEDLAALARILAPLLPAIPLTCVCSDGSCDRCVLERIVNDRCVPRPPPVRPRDPPF